MTLKSYVSKQPVSQLLKEGEQIVRLLAVIECTSFDNLKANAIAGKKDNLPGWINPVDQVAIVVGNSNGVLTHRLNTAGFTRYTELSDGQLQSGAYEDIEGFACKDGMRIEDPDRTAVCTRIMEHFIWALNCPDGMNGQDCVDSAIAGKTEFKITVMKEPWTNQQSGEITEQFRITRFARLDNTEPVVKSDLEA